MRTLIGSRTSRVVSKSEAHTPHRLQRGSPEGAVDLVPEVGDVDVDHVQVAVVRLIPDVLDDAGPAVRLAGSAHEELEKRELLRCQLDGLITHEDLVIRWVETQVTDREDRGARPRAASDECSQPSIQLSEVEGLHQVVIRTAVETPDAFLDAVRAVSMRMGSQSPRARSCRQTSNPSTSGRPTSRTMAS